MQIYRAYTIVYVDCVDGWSVRGWDDLLAAQKVVVGNPRAMPIIPMGREIKKTLSRTEAKEVLPKYMDCIVQKGTAELWW